MDLNNSRNATLPHATGPSAHTKITLYSLLLVCSLLANVLVIAVVYCNQHLRTNINFLIVNMAVSDLLVPLIALPERILGEIMSFQWIIDGFLGEALCKIVAYLSEVPLYVSSFSLVIIAFQRFIAVFYQTRRRILTTKATSFLIALTWLATTALLSPNFYTFHLSDEFGYTSCDYSWLPFDESTAQMTFLTVQAVVGFVIPLIIIAALYTIIHYKLRESLKTVVGVIEKTAIRSRQQRNKRISIMSMIIVGIFIMCWFPLCVMILLGAYQHPLIWTLDTDTLGDMDFAFPFLLYLQAAINPCIYFLFLRHFRQGLKTLFCRNTLSENEQIPAYVARNCVAPIENSNKVSIEMQQLEPHHLTSKPLQSMLSIRGEDRNQDNARTSACIQITTSL